MSAAPVSPVEISLKSGDLESGMTLSSAIHQIVGAVPMRSTLKFPSAALTSLLPAEGPDSLEQYQYRSADEAWLNGYRVIPTSKLTVVVYLE